LVPNLFVASFDNNEIVVLNRNQSFSTFASGGGLSSPGFLIADTPPTLTMPASSCWRRPVRDCRATK
jgi:hypothetical protein